MGGDGRAADTGADSVVHALFDDEALGFLQCLGGRESGTTVFFGAGE